ncbi:MAG: hypothetical protein NZP74_01080 [Anaerolineales bacterium]|nr:hypothetical protein [Anaerolineales bacterium]MDW8278211.1 hypothetical protein [Anaerolineales bacterium]
MEEQNTFWNNPLVQAFRTAIVLFFGGYLALVGLSYILAWLFPNSSGLILRYAVDPLDWMGDFVLCFAGGLFWLVFFAQFVLPVRTLSDRLRVVDRLISYLLGNHGPAIFVENGIVRERAEEKGRKGPGVIWMDSASAAVLRNKVKFTNTIGPGIHFTKADEYIAGTADLHPLSQTIGPADDDRDDRDPFRVTREKFPEEYEQIQKRRWETSALTRDGIEVVAAMAVNFRIAAKEGEGGSRFGFNKENAERAIRDSITRGANTEWPVWSELPARMAADLWREYVRKFRQDELFKIAEGRTETGLQVIAAMVNKRLKQAEVEKLDDFGRPVVKPEDECREIFNKHRRENRYADIETALRPFIASEKFSYQQMFAFLMERGKTADAAEYLEKVPSREYKTLSEMGWQVTGVNLKRVLFAPDVEERIIAQWTTLWKKNAEKERDQVERNRKLHETEGAEEALRDFAQDAIREFQPEPLPGRYQALAMLVHSTFSALRRNTALLKRTNTELRELSDIFAWLRDRSEEPR